ncbi:MAG: hypothetical protein ABIR47_02990 [Candidatus Kapaibacterium sp.]
MIIEMAGENFPAIFVGAINHAQSFVRGGRKETEEVPGFPQAPAGRNIWHIMNTIEKLEIDFISGNLHKPAHRRCPICRKAGLLFSISKQAIDINASPGRRYKAGITIYCRSECNTMIVHLDGYCPAWAEAIENWREFSDSYQTVELRRFEHE